jgi:hypothetical protein
VQMQMPKSGNRFPGTWSSDPWIRATVQGK